ncbi:MAG: sulfatase-like hydrolase/transferase, partial [Roseibacillus sp.]|nr:sulfatase-like hydrolase/transferase [Roseibacillus sp.]
APLSAPAIIQSLHDPLKNAGSRRRWEIRFSPTLYQETVKDYYRLLFGVDREVGRMREALRQHGMAENTVIIFTSDHGFYLGERGLAGKWFAHEESIRIPLVIHDPRDQRKTTHSLDKLALNIDLAPTILSYGGIRAPDQMQGRSLLPLLSGQSKGWRNDFFYEHHFIPTRIPESEAVRGERWKYIHWLAPKPGIEELYDLQSDPMERQNLAGMPSHRKRLAEMRTRWKELREAAR